MVLDTKATDPVAAASNMVDPAFLAASMIDERAPDIVEALNDVPAELATGVLLHLPADLAIEVLDQPGLDREPELITLMPRETAAKLLAGVSADRVADIFHQVKEPHCSELLDLLDADTRVNIRRLLQYPEGHRRIDHDDGIRQRSLDLYGAADPRLYPSRRKQPGNRLCDLRAGSPHQEAGQDDYPAPADYRRSGSAGAFGGAAGHV